MLNDTEDIEQIKDAVRKCIEKEYQDAASLERVSNADFQSQYNYRIQLNGELTGFIPHIISLSVALYAFAMRIPQKFALDNDVFFLIFVALLAASVAYSVYVLSSSLTMNYRYKDSLGNHLEYIESEEKNSPSKTKDEIKNGLIVEKIAANIRFSNMYLKNNKEKQKSVCCLKNGIIASSVIALICLFDVVYFECSNFPDLQKKEINCESEENFSAQPIVLVNECRMNSENTLNKWEPDFIYDDKKNNAKAVKRKNTKKEPSKK